MRITDSSSHVTAPVEPHGKAQKTTFEMGRAAFFGSLADAFVSNPFHVVKTRLQLDTSRSPSLMGHCRAMGLKDAMRGTSLNLVSTIQRRTYCYSMHHGLTSAWDASGATGLSAPAVSFLAGLGAGISEAFITTPTRRAMLLQQSQNHQNDVRGPLQAMRLILQREGVRGFWLGAPLTACRNGVASGTFFLTLGVLKGLDKDSRANDAVCGAVAAALCTVVSNPADAVKSRIQDHTGKPRTVLATAAHMLQNEGPKSFMKGTCASLLRAVPSSTVGYVVTQYALGE
jgi:hypothetical protein